MVPNGIGLHRLYVSLASMLIPAAIPTNVNFHSQILTTEAIEGTDDCVNVEIYMLIGLACLKYR